MKRLLEMLLVLCLVFGQAPAMVFATESEPVLDAVAERREGPEITVPLVKEKADTVAATSGTCGENLTWMLSEDGVLTISGTGPMQDYDYGETPWDSDQKTVTSLVIEGGVSSIGNNAFFYCTRLSSVKIADSVNTIGDNAFHCCFSLKSVEIPDSVISIGQKAFCDCDALTSVKIPSSVTYIAYDAFTSCDKLREFSVDSNNSHYSSDEWGVLFNRQKTELIRAIISLEGAYVIPDSVITVGSYAFHSCDSLVSLSIGDNVTTIGSNAFCFCDSLVSLTIGESVTTIGDHAFDSCASLTGIYVDESNPVYSSDDRGVLYDKQKTALIQAPATISGSYVIPESVITICDCAFASCKRLDDVMIGDCVTTIGNSAFANCYGLSSVTIGDRVSIIGASAFADCSSLSNVVIPDSVTMIGDAAFGYCSRLSSVMIGNSVTIIGDDTFCSCESLDQITFTGDAPSIGNYAFVFIKATVFYPIDNSTWISGVMRNYGGTITWVPYSTVTEIASGWSGDTTWVLTNDGVLTFSGTGNMKNYGYAGGQPWLNKGVDITSVVIPDGVVTIGSGAFKDLTTLKSVTFPATTLTKMGEAAFYGSGLESVEIPASLRAIGDYCFSGRYNLWKLTFEGDAPAIGTGAFKGMNADAYYPGDNTTWTSDVMQNYGGTITWKPN